MRKVLFCTVVLSFLLLSNVFAEDVSQLKEESDDNKKVMCERDIARLRFKFDNFSAAEKKAFEKRIKAEMNACKGNEECVCEIYPFLLEETNILIAEYDKMIANGLGIKRPGVGLLVPGVILTTYGVLGIVFGSIYKSDCEGLLVGESCDTTKYKAFLISGGISLGVGASALLTGSILTGIGNAKIRDAKKFRKKGLGISYNIIPVISPSEKTYGIELSFNF